MLLSSRLCPAWRSPSRSALSPAWRQARRMPLIFTLYCPKPSMLAACGGTPHWIRWPFPAKRRRAIGLRCRPMSRTTKYPSIQRKWNALFPKGKKKWHFTVCPPCFRPIRWKFPYGASYTPSAAITRQIGSTSSPWRKKATSSPCPLNGRDLINAAYSKRFPACGWNAFPC